MARHHLGLIAQVQPAAAQIARRGQCRVEHVLHVGLAVAVAVGGVARPGARQELHRTHRAGVDDPAGVAAQLDRFVARKRAVQLGSVDGSDRGARGVGGAAVGVHGLDAPDAGEQVPADTATRERRRHHAFGVLVGIQCHHRNAKCARRTDHHGRWRSGDVGGRGDVERRRRFGDRDHRGAGRIGGRLGNCCQRCHRGVPDWQRRRGTGADGSGENQGGDGGNAERGSAYDTRCVSPHCLEGGPSPYAHSTVLGSRWLVNQVTIPTR